LSDGKTDTGRSGTEEPKTPAAEPVRTGELHELNRQNTKRGLNGDEDLATTDSKSRSERKNEIGLEQRIENGTRTTRSGAAAEMTGGGSGEQKKCRKALLGGNREPEERTAKARGPPLKRKMLAGCWLHGREPAEESEPTTGDLAAQATPKVTKRTRRCKPTDTHTHKLAMQEGAGWTCPPKKISGGRRTLEPSTVF
jgi:hypothetical protein